MTVDTTRNERDRFQAKNRIYFIYFFIAIPLIPYLTVSRFHFLSGALHNR
jgi:hypothetical protein